MKTKTMTTLAILYAVNIATSYLSISITPTLRITFTFLSMSLIGYMFGWKIGLLSGFILDTLKFIVNPTGLYNPLWSIIEMAAGLIYGLLLYKKEITLIRCLATKFLVSLVCNILLTPLFLSFMYSKGFIYYMSTRVVKNLILWPIESLLMFLIINKLSPYIRKNLSF